MTRALDISLPSSFHHTTELVSTFAISFFPLSFFSICSDGSWWKLTAVSPWTPWICLYFYLSDTPYAGDWVWKRRVLFTANGSEMQSTTQGSRIESLHDSRVKEQIYRTILANLFDTHQPSDLFFLKVHHSEWPPVRSKSQEKFFCNQNLNQRFHLFVYLFVLFCTKIPGLKIQKIWWFCPAFSPKFQGFRDCVENW